LACCFVVRGGKKEGPIKKEEGGGRARSSKASGKANTGEGSETWGGSAEDLNPSNEGHVKRSRTRETSKLERNYLQDEFWKGNKQKHRKGQQMEKRDCGIVRKKTLGNHNPVSIKQKRDSST